MHDELFEPPLEQRQLLDPTQTVELEHPTAVERALGPGDVRLGDGPPFVRDDDAFVARSKSNTASRAGQHQRGIGQVRFDRVNLACKSLEALEQGSARFVHIDLRGRRGALNLDFLVLQRLAEPVCEIVVLRRQTPSCT